jgi:hypothetical protein
MPYKLNGDFRYFEVKTCLCEGVPKFIYSGREVCLCMGLRKSAAVLLLVFLVLGSFSAVAYDEEGSQLADVACTDGIDNDNDGKVDGNDSGCSKPYYSDDSEGNFYDVDASWVFSGNSAPTSSGPSVFFGSAVKAVGGSTWGDNSSGGQLQEYYIRDSDQSWGGGNITSTSVSVNGKIGTRDSYSEIIDIPAPGTGDACGDGNPGSGDGSEYGERNCPRDYGMKNEVIFDDVSSMNGVTYDVDEPHGDTVVDGLKCEEPHGSKTADVSDGNDEYFDVGLGHKQGGPDYFVPSGGLDSANEHKINSVECLPGSYTKIGEVTDYYLKDQNPVDTAGSSKTRYTTAGNASASGSTYCGDYQIKHDDDIRSTTTTVSKTGSPEIIDITNYDSYGAKRDAEPKDISVEVTHDELAQSDSDNEYRDCQNKGTYYSDCDLSDDNLRSCDTQQATVYEYNEDGFTPDESKSRTVSIYYENWNLDTSNVYQSNTADGLNEIAGEVSEYSESDFVFDKEGFYPVISDDGNSQGNDNANSYSHYDVEATGSGGDFKVLRDRSLVLDADGPEGFGNGYVAINNQSGGNHVVGASNRFLSRELKDGTVTDDYIGTGDVPTLSCPGDYTKCVASVDVKTTQSGWTSATSSSYTFDYTVKKTGSSLSTCMMYNRLANDGSSIQCLEDGGGGGYTPTDGGSCEDEVGERYIYMEGPEINEGLYGEHSGYYQACLDTKDTRFTESACVLGDEIVAEGTTANVTPPGGEPYERGGSSPDREVCLDLEGTGIGPDYGEEKGGDGLAGDNKDEDLDKKDYGGEWYDMDSEMALEYLRGVQNGTYSTASGRQLVSDSASIDSNGDGEVTAEDIDWYWRENQNPHHDIYNPEGNTFGTAIEDDCGNPRFNGEQSYRNNDNLRCNDAGLNNNGEATFYSFFTRGKRDEDYQFKGKNSSSNPYFEGYINKVEDLSNQLENGMDTDTYDTSSISIWDNSDGSQDAADQWAITEDMSWSISSRGVPYPPYSTYYRNPSNQRSGPESESKNKTLKAFGNSYAAVAGSGLVGTTDQNGNTIREGDGVWIDPDSLRDAWRSGGKYQPEDFQWPSSSSVWYHEFEFNMDLTGPDSGIGFDMGGAAPINFKSSNQKEVVRADIYFEGEPSGSQPTAANTVEELEPPMCGDDRKEFLLEELGESTKSALYDGAYACASRRDVCVDMSSSPRIVESGTYQQTDEPDENVGRLKNDEEFCGKQPSDNQNLWYDQDYGHLDDDGVQETCKENTLYGEQGVRWISSSYVNNHPNAVTGGIDDDWNAYLEGEHNRGDKSDKYTSSPDQSSWGAGESPVPTGSPNKTIDTLGFCGGDDASEYLVTQRCETDLCSTDNSIKGVAGDPDKCVLDQAEVDGVSGDERDLYSEGDKVDVDTGSDVKTIACYDGRWYNKWPVVFFRDEAAVPLDSTDRLSFQVINIQNEELTFDLQLSTANDRLDSLSVFDKTGSDEMTVTVPSSSSSTYNVRVEGNREVTPAKEIELQAESIDGGLEGYDTIDVSVENMSAGEPGEVYSDSRDVPGIGGIQVLAMMMLASVFYFIQLWN